MTDTGNYYALDATPRAVIINARPCHEHSLAAGRTDDEKPRLLDEVLTFLRKLLGYCLCVVTCGCVPAPSTNGRFNHELDEISLSDTEREAVNSLLKYLDSDRSGQPSINDERLHALCILTYSDNVELQRSASLCFAEISAKMRTPLTEDMMEPLIALLQCKDLQVLRAASLTVCNFTLNGPERNKVVVVACGALEPLVNLLSSADVEIQCHTCACLTTLATKDIYKEEIAMSGAVMPLLNLVKSSEPRVKRNAMGAVLNLSHLELNREVLVSNGALPILVEAQNSRDVDIQYYCTAAISNLAVDNKHRTMIVAVGQHDILRQLIDLLMSPAEWVQCQACLALRNLACDADNQLLIVHYDGLPKLKHIITYSSGDTLSAATACLQNLSINQSNEVPIICESFLPEISRILLNAENPESQRHAAGVIRNLAAGEHSRVLLNTGHIEVLCKLVLRCKSQPDPLELNLLIQVTAALAILADEEEVKLRMLAYKDGLFFTKLVDLVNKTTYSELQYNCAGIIGQLAVSDISKDLILSNSSGVLKYANEFLRRSDKSSTHIALWTLLHLMKDETFHQALSDSGVVSEIELQVSAGDFHVPAILELAEKVIAKANG
ncbi:uncharacterized protein LOC141909649 [Tubulanus polymorphus]|uniref:uncharacterized protein LOC141909649 n=1 Tax=Tubulanus polymorphus TaxID=672921 RepID=UPI003DA59659